MKESVISYSELSIVPKWNWNKGRNYRTNAEIPINRTKVELKWISRQSLLIAKAYQSYQSGIEIFRNARYRGKATAINRTKVELKSVMTVVNGKLSLLSIVPKWNWNTRTNWPAVIAVPINRTKVELKFCADFHLPSRVPYQSYQSGIEMDLFLRVLRTAILSIVPKWNWNAAVTKIISSLRDYQSYQSGIEISNERHFLPP